MGSKGLLIISGGLIVLCTCLISPLMTDQGYAQATQPSNMDVGAMLSPTIALELSGGTNQFGQRTLLSGMGINFGTVTFTHPELIVNGAAYLQQGNLQLEAVVNVGITFSGASAVQLSISRLRVSANSFHKTYYSPSINRSDVPTVIYDDPQKNQIGTVTQGQTSIPIRLVMGITPQQTGRISDRFRVEAQAI